MNSHIPTLTLWDKTKEVLLPGWEGQTFIAPNFGFCQVSTKFEGRIYHGAGLSEELALDDLRRELSLYLSTKSVFE